MSLTEPSKFSKCSLNWEICPLVNKEARHQNFYFASDIETEQRFVFHVHWSQQTFYAKDLNGDVLFRGKLGNYSCDSVKVLFHDGELMGKMSLSRIKVNDGSFYDCLNGPGVEYLHGPYQNAERHVSNLEQRLAVKYTLRPNGMLINAIGNVERMRHGIHKALVVSKGFQSIIYNQQIGLWALPQLFMPKFTWTQPPHYETDYMEALRYLRGCRLLYKRVLKGSTWHHYIDDYLCPNDKPRLVLEYTKDTNRLEVFDAQGVLQFYVSGIGCDDRSQIFIHKLLNMGSVYKESLKETDGTLAIHFRQVESERKIDYIAQKPSGSTICTLKSSDDGIAVTMTDTHIEWKALIVTFLFKVAIKHFAFWPVSGRRKGDEQTPSLVYSRNPNYKEKKVLDLSILSNKVKLVNAGHDRDKELAYYRVIDWENDGCVHHCVTFSVSERPGNVEAAAYDHSGSLAFSVRGLWGANVSMVVSAGEVFGINHKSKFFDRNGELILIRGCYRRANQPIVVLFQNNLETGDKQNVAEINGDSNAIFIHFMDLCNVDMEKRALIMSFALRIAYNIFSMYAKPVRTIPFPQNPPMSAL